MPISKGSPYGEPGTLPDDGVVVRSDAEASAVIEEARRNGRPLPVLGLLGGDLCRTLNGPGDEGRLRSPDAVRFPVDLGEVLLDGRLQVFVAHLVARTRRWRHAFVAMNAQFLGPWDAAPRSHPNDGRLDVFDVAPSMSLSERWKARRRLPTGTHVPHPAIHVTRVTADQETLSPPLDVWLDGTPIGSVRNLSLRVEPDALTVII